MTESGKNIFQRRNKIPYQHEWNHAKELVSISSCRGSAQLAECYNQVSMPPVDLEAKELGGKIWRIWRRESERVGASKVSLTLVLVRCLIWDAFNILFWLGIVRQALLLTMIESLRRILQYIEVHSHLKSTDLQGYNMTLAGNQYQYGQQNNSDISIQEQDLEQPSVEEVYAKILLMATILLFSSSGFFILQSDLKLKLCRIGIKCRVAMSQLIYEKSLRLHLSTSIKESSSTALSLISNEVSFIEDANKFLPYVLVGPWSLLLTSVWLAMTVISWKPVLMTLPFLVSFIMLQLYLPHWYKRVSQRRKDQTNKRIDTISAFLNSIKIVKMYVWESNFKRTVRELRQDELKEVRRIDKFTIFDLVTVGIISRILCAIVFISYLLMYDKFEAKILFTATMAYNFGRIDGLFYFPKGVKCLSDLKTACKNIKQYMLLDETVDTRTRLPRQLHSPNKVQLQLKDLSVTLENVSDKISLAKMPGLLTSKFNLEKNGSSFLNIIDKLNMELESGELMFVVGSVGSGKSTLLLSLLGETRITGGLLGFTEHAKFAYASQEPYIFSDSFKNNILNGRPFVDARYRRVIEVCSLIFDISLMPQGDETLIGPKGVTLSGGQRARLSLARAIYSEADIYLLDDPLSAVDTKVADHIFRMCIREFLTGKMVILATHQLQFMKYSDKILFLRRHRVPIFGKTSDVMAHDELQYLLDASQNNAATADDSGQTCDKVTTEVKQSNNEIEDKGGKNRTEANFSIDRNTSGPLYWFILRAGFTKSGLLVLVSLFTLSTVVTAFAEYYYRIWARDMTLLSISKDNPPSDDEVRALTLEHWRTFVLLSLAVAVGTLLFETYLSLGLRRATATLHNMMIESLFKAKMQFYDFCPGGDLSSRYAADFAIIDHLMLHTGLLVAIIVSTMLSTMIPMMLINTLHIVPYLLLLVICLPIVTSNYRRYRTLMEFNKSFRSPVYTNIANSIDELQSVRSDPEYLAQSKRRLNESQDKLTTMSLLPIVYETRLTVCMKLCSAFVLAIVFIMMFVILQDQLDLSTAGTFLLLTVMASGVFPAFMEYGSLLDSTMVSVENIKKLTELEPEEKQESARDLKQLQVSRKMGQQQQLEVRRWLEGRICFELVSLRYFEDEPPAIRELSCVIEGGKRIGVVGRTGAGKSSILGLLYRLYPFEGRITIDGVDIKSLSLAELRASLGVIPQDPVLFCDSLRRNLDPFELYDDEKVWQALEVVNLREFVKKSFPLALNHHISEGGRNFSVGQRQLVCLARAVLRSPKILFIDEATANVDQETDRLIQRTIRQCFATSTIITIAHRLNTILDYDKIMVLDAGRLIEFDTVANLLAIEGGLFKDMLTQSKQNSKKED